MVDIFSRFINSKHNLFSSSSHDQIRTSHLIKRFSRHNKINTAILLFTFLMIIVLSISAINSKNTQPKNVLGTTDTDQISITPTQSSGAREFCHQNGGQVISKTNNSGLEENICRFLDGTECDLSLYFNTGSCSIPPTPTTIIDQPIHVSPKPIFPTQSTQQYVYYVSLVQISDIEPIESRLIDYLISTLNLDFFTITNIVYDTRQGNPHDTNTGGKYNFSYYVVANKPINIDIITNYASEITISRVNPGLLPFLENDQYCADANDCVIRDNFCSNGAFNFFHTFQDGWVCRGKTDQYGKALYIYDEEKKCKAEKVFAQTDCVNNLCTPTLVATRCIE